MAGVRLTGKADDHADCRPGSGLRDAEAESALIVRLRPDGGGRFAVESARDRAAEDGGAARALTRVEARGSAASRHRDGGQCGESRMYPPAHSIDEMKGGGTLRRSG